MPVMADEKGKLAWNNLDHVDVIKTFHYQHVPCLVKGEIHQGRNDCCVWKFCVQLSGGFMHIHYVNRIMLAVYVHVYYIASD